MFKLLAILCGTMSLNCGAWETEIYTGIPDCDSEWAICDTHTYLETESDDWWNRHYYEKGLSTRDIGAGMSESIRWELYDSRYSPSSAGHPHGDFQSHGRIIFVNGSTFQNRVLTFTYEAPLPDKNSYILEAWGNCCVRLHTRDELNTVTVEVIVTVPPMSYEYCAWDVEIHYPQSLLEAIEGFGVVNDDGLPTNQEAIWKAAFRRPVEVYGTGVPHWECENLQ